MQTRKNRDGTARRIELRRLYLKEVPSEERTEANLLAFHAWLMKADRADLISTDAGDAYQQLKVELKGLYKPS